MFQIGYKDVNIGKIINLDNKVITRILISLSHRSWPYY